MSKVLLIGDLHFGERGDSEKFNQHILTFVDWAIELGKKESVDAVIQLGDWFHHRNKVQVHTLAYAIEGAKMLSEAFSKETVYVLAGNHDLFYLNRLDVSSCAVLRPYVTVIDEPTTILGDCLATPWIASGEQWDRVVNESDNHRYLFAHLELNGFMVNDKYEMEHGFSHKELKGYEAVITGHYHSQQVKDNVLYVGTPYPITMNEANESHGVFILDTETGDLEFFEYEGVTVVSIPYTDLDKIDRYDPQTTSIRVEFPDDLDDESLIEDAKKLLLEKNFEEVKIKYRGAKAKQLIEADVSDVEHVENIDAAVLGFIENSSEVEGVDKDILKMLYTEAVSRGDAN